MKIKKNPVCWDNYSFDSLYCLEISPLGKKKYSEVNFGNNIEKYRVSNSALPKNGEWKILENLDFEITELGTNPEYKKIDEKNYKLIFVKGFDGPYLTYNSITKKWLSE